MAASQLSRRTHHTAKLQLRIHRHAAEPGLRARGRADLLSVRGVERVLAFVARRKTGVKHRNKFRGEVRSRPGGLLVWRPPSRSGFSGAAPALLGRLAASRQQARAISAAATAASVLLLGNLDCGFFLFRAGHLERHDVKAVSEHVRVRLDVGTEISMFEC